MMKMINKNSLTLIDKMSIFIKPTLQGLKYYTAFLDATDPVYWFYSDVREINKKLPEDFDEVMTKLGDHYSATQRMKNFEKAIKKEKDIGYDIVQIRNRIEHFYTEYYTYKKLYDKNKL